MNPILPLNFFIPDVEARVFDDKVYLYGSNDICGDTGFCSYEYRVFSSPDMSEWTHNGISFTSIGDDRDSEAQSPLYAPDCIQNNGKYYLYYCQADATEGLAVSDKPEGRFHNLGNIKFADGDFIDPAIFIDDDGQIYYYWGQFHAKGAKISSDMHTIDKDSITENLLTEAEHDFHEGISIRKRGDRYYAVYTDISRGKATCMAYATAKSPLGPFVKGGIIIDNDGCDPGTWNNHGSIAEFNGQWYVFYHRSSQNSSSNRRVCVEKIYFNEDGSISEVEMTSQGAGNPLSANKTIEAGRACKLFGKAYIIPYRNTEIITMLHNNDVLEYRYLDFGEGVTQFEVSAASASYGGIIDVLIDDCKVGECHVARTESYEQFQKFCCRIKYTNGEHKLSLRTTGIGNRLMDIENFKFS